MNKKMMTIGLVVARVVHAHAQQAAVVAEIKVDKPLRDPSICRGPDPAGGGAGAMYYLTGSVATKQKVDGTPNFYENDGVYLWKSSDLKSWAPLGCVMAFKNQPYELYGPYRWLHKVQVVPDEYSEQRVFGVVAPEIHFARDTFWLTISMTRQGTALMKSTTGKAEGPYELVDLLTTRGGDPSLFADGADLWWLMDGGYLAKLETAKPGKETPKGRKETLVLKPAPELMRPTPDATEFPLRVGERGAFMVKAAGKYQLVATQPTASGKWDTFVASAEQPAGPYGKRRLLIAGGGQATLFQNEKGEWLAACAKDGDPDKLVIVEVELRATSVTQSR